MSKPTMSIDEAWQYCRQHRIPICYRYDGVPEPWTNGRKMPMSLRRAFVKHRQELLRMMSEGDARVCPSPVLHKSYTRMGATCQVCLEIERKTA